MRNQSKLLRWILLLGLTLRLGAALAASDAEPIGDASEYSTIARNIASRGEFSFTPGKPTAIRPPLYPALLAPFAMATPRSWRLARAGQAIIDTATIFLIYLFALGAFESERDALAAALLYALHPVFIAYTACILTESLFICLWMAALCLFVRAVKPGAKLRYAAVAGITMGVATLCRPNFMFFPPGLAAMTLLYRKDRAKLAGRLALILAACWLSTTPWTWRNKMILGSWGPVAVGGGAALWSGAQDATTREVMDRIPVIQAEAAAGRNEFEADAEMYRLAKEAYRRNAVSVLMRIPRRFASLWLTSHSSVVGVDEPVSAYRERGAWGMIAVRAAMWLFHLAILSLGVLGVIRVAKTGWTTECNLAFAAIGYYSLHVLTGYWTARYHLPALAVLLVFAAPQASRLIYNPRR